MPANDALPFQSYPHAGRALLGRMRGASARRDYGERLQRLTGQTCCAYCGLDLTGDYHRWLLLTVDHVVPTGEAIRLGIPADFYQDYANLVLACGGCNGMDNRCRFSRRPQTLWTLEEFFDFRDATFRERSERIAAAREREIAYFNRQEWLAPLAPDPTSTLPVNGAAPSVGGERSRVLGVDFSGAVDAGRKLWVATGRIDGDHLVIETCLRGSDLPGARRDRASCLAALRSVLAGANSAVVGLDFPFSLPRTLIPDESWCAFARRFPDRFPDAETFKRTCARIAEDETGRRELRRETDREAKTPFSPYNLRLYLQTYHGIRDVLAPLVAADTVRVLPMQPPTPNRPWLIEICPASTLKRLGVSQPYKGKGLDTARESLLAHVEAACSMHVPDAIKALAVGDDEGDALDSLIAAAATFGALRDGRLSQGAATDDQAIEGLVYA